MVVTARERAPRSASRRRSSAADVNTVELADASLDAPAR
jgi:hypothetical protein